MIKQGYALEVTSWENDGDCYNTKRFDGLTLEQAAWLVRFLEKLSYTEQHETPDFDIIFEQLPTPALLHDWHVSDYLDEADGYKNLGSDLAGELVGYGYETGYLRVADSWKVFYIPFDIPEVQV